MSHKHTKSPKSPANMPPLEIAGIKAGGGGKDTSAAKLEDIDIQQLTTYSVPITRRVNALKNEQVKLLELESKFFEELHELECKYAKLYDPIFEKRRKIVIGELEPTEDEAKWALDEADESKKEDGEKTTTENGETKEAAKSIDEAALTESGKKLLNDLKTQFGLNKDTDKGIPHFWLETLQTSRITSEMIQEHDEPVLAYLQDLRVKMNDKKPLGYTLEFEFAENPYFTNKTLTKTYELKTDVDKTDPFSYEGPDLEKSIGCKIDWKPNKNVTVKLIKKKLKSRNKKAPPKIVTKEEKQESFFTYFDTPKVGASGDSAKQVAIKKPDSHPDDDDDDDDALDEETAHDLYLMADFETGQYIKDKIIPKAVLYYTGELNDMDDDEDDYDGDDYEDGEDDEDNEDEDDDDDDDDKDDEDDDDDDEDDHKGKKGSAVGKGGKKGGSNKPVVKGSKPGEPTPSECKQN